MGFILERQIHGRSWNYNVIVRLTCRRLEGQRTTIPRKSIRKILKIKRSLRFYGPPSKQNISDMNSTGRKDIPTRHRPGRSRPVLFLNTFSKLCEASRFLSEDSVRHFRRIDHRSDLETEMVKQGNNLIEALPP